jgi:pyruvate formate lyase activating enzyme
MGGWLADHTGRGTPLHISRYFPRFRLKRPPTPQDVLRSAEEVFSRHLDHVYLGNVREGSRTLCPECGSILVSRGGHYGADASGLSDDGLCSSCGAASGIVVGQRDG